jgi:predicted membrane protein
MPIIESTEKFLKNEYVVAIIFVLAILYGSLVAPKLPESTMKIIRHPIFLFIALVLIAFVTTKNKKVAVVVGIALAITLVFVENNNNLKKLQNLGMNKEHLDNLAEIKNDYPKELSGYDSDIYQ